MFDRHPCSNFSLIIQSVRKEVFPAQYDTGTYDLYVYRGSLLYANFINANFIREHSHMTSDVFGSFLTYLPTLIRYHQMWLDLPTYLPLDLTPDFEKITSPINVDNMDLVLLLF